MRTIYIVCMIALLSAVMVIPAVASASPPYLVTYTISNRTITPPQTTEIDVDFSETVSYKIAIEKDAAAIYDWTGTAKNPAPKIWNGTYEANGTVVPDGDYRVNVTGTNTSTGLSMVNNTEVITVMSITEQPDLIVSKVNAYHYEDAKTGYAWFNLTNYVDVTVKNNGTADADAFNVSLYADSEFIGEKRISNLSAGSNETLVFEWIPIGIDEQDGGSPRTYSMLAIADPYNAVSESDEFNNNMTVGETAKYNGYMADEPLHTFSHGTLRGGLLFTTGDANYIGATYPGLIGTVHYNVDIPQTSSVMLARLNIYYTWAKYWSPYPVLRVEITNQTGSYNVSLENAYHDRPGSFSGWNLPWGNYVYDLSDYIKQNGSYTVSIYNNGTGYQSLAIASPGLVVLYSDDSMPLIEYWLAEGADVLMGGRRSDSGSYLALEECINNASFEGSIELSRVKNAVLGTVSPWGAWGWFPGSGNVLYFNDAEIGRSPNVYLNGWNPIGDISLGGIRMTGSGAAQVGVNLSNVTDYLNTNINTAGQGDDGDNMMPSNAFLLVEVTEVPDFSISVSPSSASIIRGGSTNATVTLTGILGYDKNVTLGASGMPLNTTISFTPEKGKPDYTSTMSVKTDNTTPVGSYPITINGTGDDAKVRSTIFTLSVTTAKPGANASVSLTTNIIPAIAIEVTPSSIDFGELSPGETSGGKNLTVKNKGGYSINVSAEVTDSAENLFVDGVLLNDKLWNLYSAVIPKSGDDKPVAKLHVPDDYAGAGSKEGTMMFWAKKA